MPQAESFQVIVRPGDGTGRGVVVGTWDVNGLVMNSPFNFFVGDAMVSPRAHLTAPLLAASVDNYFWGVNTGRWQVTSVMAAQTVAGGSGAAVDLKVCGPTVAPASGTTQLSAAIDLATAGNNGKDVPGVVIASPTVMAPGDRLALDFSGTLTALVGLLSVNVKRVG